MHLGLRSLDFVMTDDVLFSIERELVPQYRQRKMWSELIDVLSLLLPAALAGARHGPWTSALRRPEQRVTGEAECSELEVTSPL
jgi:hypothetical protein